MTTNEIQMSPYQRFIALSRYARYLPEEQRRETWEETVGRYCTFMSLKFPLFPLAEMQDAITSMQVMPSMRAMMTAGPALELDNVPAYNCAYIAVDDFRAFDEILYILMCGTGVGFSVERQFIADLPVVSDSFRESSTTVIVEDSRIGWAQALREVISMLYGGHIPRWDVSRLREAGAPLKTFGGRSSGPGPLVELFEFAIEIFRGAAGRRLNSRECHDLICKTGDVVVVGGVRRSALISLSNLSDKRMGEAKTGAWWTTAPWRALANNSTAYTEKPEMRAFMDEWVSLYESKSGERGIFNRNGVLRKMERSGRRDHTYGRFGTNPCGEINLRSMQFCNLTEVVVRAGDDSDSIDRKVELAAILGTFQSCLTDFRHLRAEWRRNVEEERLLGVSLTGIMDNPLTAGVGLCEGFLPECLERWRATAINTNIGWAEKLGVPRSAAVTCGKPSGTVSQLVDAASGIHRRFSRYYLRAVRNDKKDPLSTFMIERGVPHETDVTKESNWVFYFPQQSPPGSVTMDHETTAVEQLDHYLAYTKNWAEHNMSTTIYVRENEWLDAAAWVYRNFDNISGVSFLPHTDHVYKQAPYQAITEEEYRRRVAEFPVLDFREFTVDEHEDNTQGARLLACVGEVCELT